MSDFHSIAEEKEFFVGERSLQALKAAIESSRTAPSAWDYCPIEDGSHAHDDEQKRDHAREQKKSIEKRVIVTYDFLRGCAELVSERARKSSVSPPSLKELQKNFGGLSSLMGIKFLQDINFSSVRITNDHQGENLDIQVRKLQAYSSRIKEHIIPLSKAIIEVDEDIDIALKEKEKTDLARSASRKSQQEKAKRRKEEKASIAAEIEARRLEEERLAERERVEREAADKRAERDHEAKLEMIELEKKRLELELQKEQRLAAEAARDAAALAKAQEAEQFAAILKNLKNDET